MKMTIEEQIERLTGIVNALAGTVVSHDNQIEGLIKVAEQQSAQIAQQSAQIAAIERQWQAYINTLPRH
jgi:ABC-type transporter Mla subunit MlaD